jgi:hypothetical protein
MAWEKMAGSDNTRGFRYLSYQTIAKLAQNPGQLAMIRAAAGHPDVVKSVMSEDQAEAALAQIRAANAGKVATSGRSISAGTFVRGRIYRHKPTGRKVTIIHAAAGRKDGETVHEVVDGKTGKKFYARESNLKSLS